MAKRRRKARKGHRRRRLSAKQRRAMKRNLAKAHKALRAKRKGKKRKSKKGKKKSKKRHPAAVRATSSSSSSGISMAAKLKMRRLAAKLVARGYTEAEAAARIARMTAGAHKDVTAARVRAAEAAAKQGVLANMFAGFGMAGAAKRAMNG